MSTSGTTPAGFRYWYDLPTTPAAGTPWALIGPTGSTGYTAAGVPSVLTNQLLAAGFAIGGIWLPGLDGAEFGFGAQYPELNTFVPWFASHFGLAAKPAVYAQSKAGLDLIPWMRDNPAAWTRASLMFAACDPHSYPLSQPGLVAQFLSAYQVPDVATFDSVYYPTRNALNGASTIPGANVMEWGGTADTAVPLAQNGALLSAACGSTVLPIIGMNHVLYQNYDIGRWITGAPMVPIGTDFLRITFSANVPLTTAGNQQLFPDIIDFDADTIFNPGTGTITINHPGLYVATAQALFSGAASWVGIQINGTFFETGSQSVISAGLAPVTVSTWLSTGDTLQLWASNTSPGASIIAAPFGTFFTLKRG